MPGDMNVSNRLVIGANRDLGKTDRLDGHKQIEKTTDQVASEALSKTETVDVFSLIRAKPLPKPPSAEQLQNRAEQFGDNMVKLGDGRASLDSDLETFVPMPSLEQFEEDSKSMSSVKQDAETPKASKMGTAERTGRLLAANLAELGERIQAVASNILGGAKKLYGEVKSAIESKPQVKVPEEVKSDFGKNLYRALSDGSLNSLSHEGIASKIEMIKDESERAVLNKLLDQKIPSPSGEKIESEENGIITQMSTCPRESAKNR